MDNTAHALFTASAVSTANASKEGVSPLAHLAIALPCLPGGADKLRDLARQCAGPRRAEFDEFHRRVDLSAERWFLQQTPQGDLCIIALEGDPTGAMAKLGASQHPFDVWFREAVKGVHGVDFAALMPGPPPVQVFESAIEGVPA